MSFENFQLNKCPSKIKLRLLLGQMDNLKITVTLSLRLYDRLFQQLLFQCFHHTSEIAVQVFLYSCYTSSQSRRQILYDGQWEKILSNRVSHTFFFSPIYSCTKDKQVISKSRRGLTCLTKLLTEIIKDY